MMHGGNVWQGGFPEKWLDFSANIRPGGAPAWVREALREAEKHVSWYPDPEMTRARRGLGEHLGLDPAWVLPTAGGISALRLAMSLPFEELLLPVPCFSEYGPLAQAHEKKVRILPLVREGQRLLLSDVLPAPLPRNCLICLGNPVNPLGIAWERAEIEALLEKVEAAQGWLLMDEAFIDYCPGYSARALLADHNRLLIAGSLTKILGIPGVRLGYLCGQPKTLTLIRNLQLPWELNCFASAVACALPGQGADFRAEAARNALRREGMRQTLTDLGLFVHPSEASFLLVRSDFPAARMAEGLRERGILVRECMDFQGLADGHHLRLAVREEPDVRRLTKAMREVFACAGNH